MDYVKEYKQNMEHQYKSDLRNSYIRRKSLVEARGVDLSKLNILGQRNSLPKCGKPSSNSEHIFRVLTKEGTPVSICPSVPNFGCVRNSQTKNVLSYCLDNRRFMESNVKNLRSLLRVRWTSSDYLYNCMIAIGTVLDKYRIINSIGIGSFSYVYLARHAET